MLPGTTRWPDGNDCRALRLRQCPPADETAHPASVQAWRHAEELFAGSHVELCCVDMSGHLEYCYSLRVFDVPTYRILLRGREIGRTNFHFSSAERLADWVRPKACDNSCSDPAGSSADKMEDERNHREDEQQMDESTRDMKGKKPTGPNEHKEYGDK
jgi:hypothetical protein